MRADWIRRYAKHRVLHSGVFRAWICRQHALLPSSLVSTIRECGNIMDGEPPAGPLAHAFATADGRSKQTRPSFHHGGDDRRREGAVYHSSLPVHPSLTSSIAPTASRSISLSATPRQQYKADVAASMHPEEDDDGDLMDLQDPPSLATGAPGPFPASPSSPSYPLNIADESSSSEAAAEAHSRAVSAAAARVAAAAAAGDRSGNAAASTSGKESSSGDREALRDVDLDDPARRPLEERLEKEAIAPLQISPEARRMFEAAWEKVIAAAGGVENLAPPKEIVWLNGAPGAGKGANTPFILKTRGFEARAIQVSQLLEGNEEVSSIMRSGGLVSDSMVLQLVVEEIMNLGNRSEVLQDADHSEAHINFEDGVKVVGAVADGFPRTTLQVDFIKLLYDRLLELHNEYLDTPLEAQFPRPIFRIAVLYVEEEESVRRQLSRGRAAILHNQKVLNSGFGELQEVRPTDLCEKSARRRYHIFRQHYDTLLRLRAFFPFHLIDGMGTLSECREQIEKELQYQSALELDATTFRSISHIPLASDIAKYARQNMVTRLDNYQQHHQELFRQVIDVINEDVLPIIRRCALAGIAIFNTEQPLLLNNPVAAEMLADVLSERGYSVTWQSRSRDVPVRIDPTSYSITTARRTSYQFRIKFDRPLIRNSDSSNSTTTVSATSPRTLPPSSFALPPLSSPPSPLLPADLNPPPPVAPGRMCASLPGGQPPCYSAGPQSEDSAAPGNQQPCMLAGPCGKGDKEGGLSSGVASAGGILEPSEQLHVGTRIAVPGMQGEIIRPPGCPPPPSWLPVKEEAKKS